MTNNAGLLFRSLIPVASALLLIASCETSVFEPSSLPANSPRLDSSDVQTIIAHAVELAQSSGKKITVAVTDREANVLGVFAMNGSTGTPNGSIAKARTAAYLSSNQHAFTTLTACFITRRHFPPDVRNTAGGPLFGVPFSSLFGGNIQPNGALGIGEPGLVGTPGGVPIFKDGSLAGGVGITGVPEGFEPNTCSGATQDESIALGAITGYAPPQAKRGDNIMIDGIRILYSNASPQVTGFALIFADINTPAIGTIDAFFPITNPPAPRFPPEGEVNLDSNLFDFRIRAGSILLEGDVRQIIGQAAQQAGRTRAAIRTPLGLPAQVFIAVVDTDGAVLGIWRTPDATLFSFDVCAQKARTALAFSNPQNLEFGQRIRSIVGRPTTQALSVTTRAVGFLAQDFFPPGIDRDTLGHSREPGPLFEGPEFMYQARIGLLPYGNGITIFPGGIPLYKNGQLAGAIGISGDGVDQDDLIAFAGTLGFEAPESIRCDNFFYDGVRLPYVKFPRSPEVP